MGKKNSIINQLQDFIPEIEHDDYEDDHSNCESDFFEVVAHATCEYAKISLELTKLIVDKGYAKSAEDIMNIFKRSQAIVFETSLLKDVIQK